MSRHYAIALAVTTTLTMATLGGHAPRRSVAAGDHESFSDCGVLIQGIECPLFESDHFGTYFVGFDLGDYGIGDRLRVAGTLDPHCTSFCMEGDGCILEPTFSPCEPVPVLQDSWGAIKTRFL
jgi:hypothetical protein